MYVVIARGNRKTTTLERVATAKGLAGHGGSPLLQLLGRACLRAEFCVDVEPTLKTEACTCVTKNTNHVTLRLDSRRLRESTAARFNGPGLSLDYQL